MGIVTGYICLIMLLLLLVKVLARKFKWNKINKALMKSHKYIAFLFLVVSIIHFILVLGVLEGRHILVTISGIVILVAGIMLTIVCHVVKNHKVENKFHHFFSLVMVLMLVVHMGTYFVDFSNYLKSIDAIKISGIDLANVEDGTYIGEYDAGYVYAKVKVIVYNHTITDVEILKHVTERGKPAEVITEDIVENQSVKVDAVSSATNSSKVIMKACENALREK